MRMLATLMLAAWTAAASAQQGFVTTLAGSPEPGLRDASGRDARFNRPTWVDVDTVTGAVYVVDRANRAIRRIDGTSVSTLAVRASFDPNAALVTYDFGGAYGGGIAVEPRNGGCGAGPYDRGIFISSSATNQLLLIADFGWGAQYAARDDSSAVIGTGIAGSNDGTQTVARFASPGDVALSWNYPSGFESYTANRVYIADTGNHTIRQIRFRMSFEGCPQPYFVETLAGRANEPGSADGDASAARFNAPRGVASAPDGSVYVADTGNHTIRRIWPDGHVTTVAGTAGVAGSRDGGPDASLLSSPAGIDVNALGEVFIADSANHTLRKLTPEGQLITLAGAPGQVGFADGAGRNARFAGPVGVRIAGDRVYIADTSNNAIRVWSPSSGSRRHTVRH